MLSQFDTQQLAYAASVDRCLLTHNRVDFERLHLEYMAEGREHSGIIVTPQKNAMKLSNGLLFC